MKRATKNLIISLLLTTSLLSIAGTMYYIYAFAHPKIQGGTPPSISSSITQGSDDASSTSILDNKKSGSKKPNSTISIYFMIALGCESLIAVSSVLYLIVSKGSKRKVSEAMNSRQTKIAGTALLALITGGFSFSEVYIANHYLVNAQKMKNSVQTFSSTPEVSSTSVKATGKITVTTKKTLTGTYTSNSADENAILIQKNGSATISNATIKKTGQSSHTNSSDFTGVNAGVLASNGTAVIQNSTITTNGKGANAIFATGSSAKISLSNTTIKTTGSSSSRGLDATYGGRITGKKLTVSTSGNSSATLATDRGGGTLKVSNSKLLTSGSGSPLIYSTGKISVTKTTGTAKNSQIVVVEGKNSATVNNSTLSASGKGNRGKTDQSGVMIYQSNSGDASTGRGRFNATNSTLSILKSSSYYKSAPMFFVTNTNATINLTNTKLNFGSGTLLSVKGTSAWGSSGSNGGNVTINASKQTLEGNMTADALSTLNLHLTNNSSFMGAINANNKAKKVTLSLDASSKITLTHDTYVTSLKDADTTYSNINFNGYKLYVNGKAIN